MCEVKITATPYKSRQLNTGYEKHLNRNTLFLCHRSLTRNTTKPVVENITIKPNIAGCNPVLILSHSSIAKREGVKYCDKTVSAPDMGLEPMTLRLKV